jgi:hypothetical protein
VNGAVEGPQPQQTDTSCHGQECFQVSQDTKCKDDPTGCAAANEKAKQTAQPQKQKPADKQKKKGCDEACHARRHAAYLKFAADSAMFLAILLDKGAEPAAEELELQAAEAEAVAEAETQAATEGSMGGPTAGKRFTDAERAEDAGQNCTYCGRETTEEPGHPNSRQTDHIYPKSRGGNTDPSNRAPACAECNQSKGARTPSEWRASLFDKLGPT